VATTARRRVFEHPWRVAIVAVVLLIVLNLGIVLLANADTSPGGKQELPSAVESINPERGQLTGLVDNVTVDLADNLQGELIVDGVQIPDDQLDTIPQLGVITFRPGPGKDLTRLLTGENTVVVHYWPRGDSRPENPASYSWRFRAAA
jgi:hypothetical protein